MAAKESMKAYQYSELKGRLEDSFSLTTIPTPTPPTSSSSNKPSILIAVGSVSLNPADYANPEIPILGRLVLRRPATPCFDLAGTIVTVPESQPASSAMHFKPGDRVFGRLDFPPPLGSLAEYTLAAPHGLAHLPASLSFAQGAAMATAGVTAYQALKPYIKSGDRVFINGGSGGVGSFAIQIAKLLGATHVTVSCSAANASLCQELGADEVIDYRTVDVGEQLKRKAKETDSFYDHMVDNVAAVSRLYEESHAYLKEGGTFVQIAAYTASFGGVGIMLSRWLRPSWLGGGRRTWTFMLSKVDAVGLAKLAEWAESGKIKVVLDSEYDFEHAREAFARLRTGRARGKIVVNVVTEG